MTDPVTIARIFAQPPRSEDAISEAVTELFEMANRDSNSAHAILASAAMILAAKAACHPDRKTHLKQQVSGFAAVAQSTFDRLMQEARP